MSECFLCGVGPNRFHLYYLHLLLRAFFFSNLINLKTIEFFHFFGKKTDPLYLNVFDFLSIQNKSLAYT